MGRDNEHNPDPNITAHRVVRESTASADRLPADIEAAWLALSAHTQNVDERGRTLLKAAFEAGWEAGRAPTALELSALRPDDAADTKLQAVSDATAVRIPPGAYFKSVFWLAWGCVRHPFTTTVVDLTTGKSHEVEQ